MRFTHPATAFAAVDSAPSREIHRMAPRVSLTMIVKNEEANLPACLASAADLVDEVVVVDTGSTDRTKEVAARFGARIFDFPWIDDFAAARNEALRHATGDWILWLDADDRIDEPNRQKFRQLFAAPARLRMSPIHSGAYPIHQARPARPPRSSMSACSAAILRSAGKAAFTSRSCRRSSVSGAWRGRPT